MRHLTYIGPHDEVEVVDQGVTVAIVKHGEECEFEPALAESLLEQPANWAAPAKAKAKPKTEEV